MRFPVDIFDEERLLRVIAELPGAEEKDIRVYLKGNELTITARTTIHEYYQVVNLPCAPEDDLKKAFRNGLLEIRLEK